MANDWFQFKQFRIQQDRCAMKVSTDACIQGALAAAYCQASMAMRGLDIGTGTGLLSLMIAQQNPGLTLDALELDPDAFEQAKDNCRNAPWKESIHLFHTALQDFESAQDNGYDFIVCNPPFFHNHLQAAQQQRNQARHSITLTKEELAKATRKMLKPGGYCCILYPAQEWAAWEETAIAQGLHAQHITYIKPTTGKAFNRVIGFYSSTIAAVITRNELVIYEAPQIYTPEFRELMQPFYLHL